ncbi:TlpA family protein disulfide reductase [Flavobacterium hungaricum]|uniref:TlpA family protein disulfide reductase n=1 Tax=Flavobacterium hungaricum TaxID=2082725 RepID=A0ABR9TIB1_9FLAO|nr:TlpA disulfide reductase family protein [Flavobacterium hungaricum]MBE8725085.1 TlpA family protein disulfide reductase [Flavobacterium hungaricum]
MNKYFIIVLVIFNFLLSCSRNEGEVKFTTNISNNISDSLVITGADNFRKVISLDKKGNCNVKFNVTKGFYDLLYANKYVHLYLKPNAEINLAFDANDISNTIIYEGKGIDESKCMAKYLLKNEKIKERALKTESSNFTLFIEDEKKVALEYINKGDYDSDFKDAMIKSLEAFYAEVLRDYEEGAELREVNNKSPKEFEYENYKGGKTKLSDFKGKYVYITFWTLWNDKYLEEFKYIRAITDKYKDKNVVFVNISIEEQHERDSWRKYIEEKKLDGIQLISDRGFKSDFITKCNIKDVPVHILIDPKGYILSIDAWDPSSLSLQSQFETLLK